MSKRRQHSELVWLGPHAGFSTGLSYAVPMPEHMYYYNPAFSDRSHEMPSREERVLVATMEVEDWTPCMLDCHDPHCREWTNVWLLPGQTRAEAMANLVSRCYSGAAYHVSECEMLDDRM